MEGEDPQTKEAEDAEEEPAFEVRVEKKLSAAEIKEEAMKDLVVLPLTCDQ